MSERDLILAADVGGTYVRVGAVDSAGRLVAHAALSSALIDHPREGPAKLTELLQGQLAAWGDVPRRLSALALGFPSTVSRDRRTVLQTPNLRGFDSVPLADLLEEKFHVPVIIEKDVVFLLANDMWSLGLSAVETTIGVYFGTGIGNAIFMNGAFFTGKNGVAGELGHVPLRGGARQCGCHNLGCMETEASGSALARIAAERFPGEPVADIFALHGDSAPVSAFLEMMSHAPAVEINILDPDQVVIGGGVVRMSAFPRDELRRRILSHVRRPLPFDEVRIHFSPADEYGGILGGARLAAALRGGRRGRHDRAGQ